MSACLLLNRYFTGLLSEFLICFVISAFNISALFIGFTGQLLSEQCQTEGPCLGAKT
jgi:hypothetical protein